MPLIQDIRLIFHIYGMFAKAFNCISKLNRLAVGDCLVPKRI